MVDIAISAPARSIDAAATSTSRRLMTSRSEVPCTSTSYIDTSSESGSIPWLIVRLPCGSRSTQSTRWPRSTNAAARLRVVVVFATPPFWLVKAMTLALGVITRAVFARSERNPSPLSSGACATGQAARARDGQGRGRQDDHRRRARARRRARRQAHGGVRGGRAGAARRHVRRERHRSLGARTRARTVRRVRRPRAGEGGVARLPAALVHAGGGGLGATGPPPN